MERLSFSCVEKKKILKRSLLFRRTGRLVFKAKQAYGRHKTGLEA